MNPENIPIVKLILTEDEFTNILNILSRFQRQVQYPDDNLDWYDYEYIMQSLEFARKEGEEDEVNQ